MNFRRSRGLDGIVTAAATLSAVLLCDAASMPVSRSIASGLLFVSSVFGLQRIYSAVVDILTILVERRSPGDKRAT